MRERSHQESHLKRVELPKSYIRSYERMSIPRVCVGSEQFRLNPRGPLFSISNISQKGMGLWIAHPEDIHLFSVGTVFAGVINIERQKFLIQAQVRHRRPDFVGCQFETISPEMSQALSEHLDPNQLGKRLKLLPYSSKNTMWFHGPGGTELLLVKTEKGSLSRFTLSLAPFWVRWDQDLGVSTGQSLNVDDPSDIRGVFRHETFFLIPDEAPNFEQIDIAKAIILGSHLAKDLKDGCLNQLNSSAL